MKSRITSAAACLALAGAALVGGAGTAHAAQPTIKFRSAWFKVQIEGVQTTSWTHNHVKSFDCDSNSSGKGTEVVRFKSKPRKMNVFQVGDSTPLFSNIRGSSNELDLRSKITRRGERKSWGGKVCSYGDGKGGTPRPPDCGTKYDNGLSVKVDYGQKNLVGAEQSLFVPLGPFFNCPTGGTSWPSLLDYTSKRGKVGKRYSPKRLFNKKRKKHVIEAAGREEVNSGDDTSVTTMHWYLTLKRTKAPKRKR